MNSLDLIRDLHSRGLLRKEAAVRIVSKRNTLLKQAMILETERYFGFRKEAGILDFLHGSKPAAAAATRVPESLSFGKSMRNIAPLLALAGLVTVGSTAAKVGLGALGDLKTKNELDRSYGGMFNEFPDLSEDRPQATKYFDMMAKYAPALASNPLIAGTWVKQMMNMNVVDPKNIHSLIDAQAAWEDVHSMKSPLLSFTRDFPATKDILVKSLAMAPDGS